MTSLVVHGIVKKHGTWYCASLINASLINASPINASLINNNN